ncbi:7-methylguanosine phosphate-specific 5'-nucleotidase-like isoform X1 [Girardinichthys multiradiatus]|uniref:7-methylguanosine phosphate-specific 5'-nucleotidase-like isoform X1 n=1 Tax=Girardinichthys multiradiatus TaxID=208333 RepID=UPI001FAD017B|nr:7-methylguanosine phosphate-specific 5'-nucleotidase-like isoform X1 [Girardinichthys multiradiatus]
MQIYHIPWIYTPVRTVLAIWHQLTKTEITELTKGSVMMRERSRVEDTIYSMQKAGPDSLQVISDFDMTLTRFSHKGKRLPTTHNILNNRLLINEDSTKKMKELLNTYYPIEIDPSLSPEEKLPYMVTWWTEVHELLIQQRIRKDMLAQVVRESSAMLREGYRVFFDCLAEHRVPLLIFSAGVADVLEEVIRQNDVFHPNLHIISNYMDFDHTGVLQAFKGQLIHSYNKRDGALSHATALRELHGRPNVLLLGDSLGDLNMADGVSEAQNILTVGFLNDQVEERKESYINSFDIVLLKDETMDIPNAILRHIVSPEMASKVQRKK